MSNRAILFGGFSGSILLVGVAFGTDSSIPFINANQVHTQGITGRGVTVAVIDTGVDSSHPGLDGSVGGDGTGFEGGQQQDDGGENVYGETHGTYMALVITDASGVAPDARILSVRALGAGGQGAWRDVVRAIRYVVARRLGDPSIRVINLSLGGGEFACNCDFDAGFTRDLATAISDAAQAGIITFAATGNEVVCGGIGAPACVTDAVRVAASYDAHYSTTDFGDCGDFSPPAYWITCFSNIVEDCNSLIAAPGYDIKLWANTPYEFSGDGTSQATAHCSGVAALMFEKNACGSLDAYSARNIIFNTASEHKWAFPRCPLPPEPRHVNALAAVNAVSAGTCGSVGDLDCDGVVSAFDFQRFDGCMTGPGGGSVTGFCSCADFPQSPPDGDVDLRDFAAFQLAFTGYGQGACCHSDATCTEEHVNDCLNEFGAAYQGHGTSCATSDCPSPTSGACCDVTTLACTQTQANICAFSNGFFLGGGTTCATATCPTARYRNVIDPLTNYTSCGPGLQLGDDMTLSGSGPYSLAFYDAGVFGGGGGPFNATVGLYTNCPGSGGTLIPGTEHAFTNNPDNGSPVFLQMTFNPPVPIPNSFWMVITFSTPEAGWFRAEQAEIGTTENLFGRNDPPWACNYWFGGSPYAGFWANIGCVDTQGACCQSETFCSEETQADCSTAGGIYQGHGTFCVGVDCAADMGACCDPGDGTCSEGTEAACTASGGNYQGNGTTCAAITCPFGRYSNEIDPVTGFVSQQGALALADDMTLAGTGARELTYYDLLVYGNGGGSFNVTASLYTNCPGSVGTLIAGTSFTWNGVPDDGFLYTLERDLSSSPVTIPDTVWMVVQFSNSSAAWVLAGTAETGFTDNFFGVNQPPRGCNFWLGGNPYAGFWANLRCIESGSLQSKGSPKAPIVRVSTARALSRFDYAVSQDRLLDDSVPGFYSMGVSPRRTLRGGSATVTIGLDSPMANLSVHPNMIVQWSVSATASQGDNAGLALVSVDLAQDASNPQFFDIPPASSVGSGMQGFDRPDGIANPGPGGIGSAYAGTPVGPVGQKNLIQIGGAQNTFGVAAASIGLDVAVDGGIGQRSPQTIASGSFSAPSTPGVYSFNLANGTANVLTAVSTPPGFSPVSQATVVLNSPAFTFSVCRVGDVNASGATNINDIPSFTIALLDPSVLSAGAFCSADVNGDGIVDGRDIQAFADLLLSP